ncbi:peptidylprolyl isomerase [Candidatus Woesearchaeota archaeon]|jgi:peptidylprolyl isomerase|nr:peptidylprolyl isomerase [Candidatus Woesearchaeota archaeon]
MTQAILTTNLGTIKIKIYTDSMPITTKNFIDLAKRGFYDNTKFHRVIPKFMIQGGDPQSKNNAKRQQWGTGGPGYKISDEFTDNNKNFKGSIAMANSGPNTGGSQFFINVAGNHFLDNAHPVFGEVIDGLNIVIDISKTKRDHNDQPDEDVVLEKVTIEE